MRKVFAMGVAAIMVCGAVMACSSNDEARTESGSTSASTEPAASDSANIYFEGNVDPVQGKFEIVYRSANGDILHEATGLDDVASEQHPDAILCTSNLVNPLLYQTSLTATAGVFLHTVSSRWTTPNLAGGVCPMNLWTNPVCNFTAWIDALTITSPQAGQSVGVLDNPPGGGMTTAWSCASGDGGGTPGVPPCSFSYGNVSHTAALCTNPHPWTFHESGPGSAAGFAFSFRGHVSGDQPTL